MTDFVVANKLEEMNKAARNRNAAWQAWSLFLVFLWSLFLVFLTLRLIGAIDWNWAWVLAPLWGPPAFVFAALLVFLWGWGCVALWRRIKRRFRKGK